MFLKQPEDYGPADIADHFLGNAKAEQLTALAKYFESQAKRLHIDAAAIRATERRTFQAHHQFDASRRAFLATGARVALLIQRGLPARAALAQVKQQTRLETDVLRAALASWRRDRKRLGMGKL